MTILILIIKKNVLSGKKITASTENRLNVTINAIDSDENARWESHMEKKILKG